MTFGSRKAVSRSSTRLCAQKHATLVPSGHSRVKSTAQTRPERENETKRSLVQRHDFWQIPRALQRISCYMRHFMLPEDAIAFFEWFPSFARRPKRREMQRREVKGASASHGLRQQNSDNHSPKLGFKSDFCVTVVQF